MQCRAGVFLSWQTSLLKSNHQIFFALHSSHTLSNIIWGYMPTHYRPYTVYPKKYAHGFVVLCFVVVMQSFIMNSHEVFIHIHQGCFAGTGAIVRLPQCQWSKPDGYGKISQCITTTKHSKAKTVCIFLGIYCIQDDVLVKIWFNGFHSNFFKIIFKNGWCRTEGTKRVYGGLMVMAWYRSMPYAFKVQPDITFVFCEVNILDAKYHICQHKKPKHLETCRFEWFISKIHLYHFWGDYCLGWCVFEKDNY